MRKDDKNTEEERGAMRECIVEAFWYRSLPLSLISGSVALLAMKTGRIQMKTRYGALWFGVGLSSLGYIVGKFSYILSDRCMDVFLAKAPRSSISENVRRRRETEGNLDGNLPNRFMDILEEVDEDKMSRTEQQILEECNTVAFYRYSLPLSVVFGGSMYLAVKTKLLNESRMLTSFPRIPKTLLGSALGYIIGQYLYVRSADCPKRFQKYDHEGTIARLLRGDREELNQSYGVQSTQEYTNTQDYVLSTREDSPQLERRIKETWTNSLDNSFKP